MNILGRCFSNDIVAIKNEQGDWEISVTMTEKLLTEGSEWEEKKVAAKCTDKDFSKAYEVAMNSTLSQLSDIVKETGSDSLFGL